MVGDPEPGDEQEFDVDDLVGEPLDGFDASEVEAIDEADEAALPLDAVDDGEHPGDVLVDDEDGDRVEDDGPLEPIVVEPWQPPVRRHRWLARLVGVAALAIPTAVAASVALRATGLQPEQKLDERLIGALRYDGEGNPLVRSPKTDVGTVQRREWRVCGKSCDQVSGRGKEFRPGEVLAGSRVQVRVIGTGGEETIETPGWDGQLKALRRPTMSGEPRVGATVEASPAKWTGGWLEGDDYTGLRACPTRAGGGKCVAFTISTLGVSDRSRRTIPAAFRGWWIGAIEWHVPPGRVITATTDRDPETPDRAERAPAPGATVKVGPLQGPIR